MCVYIYICILIYTYIYIHMFTYIYIHICFSSSGKQHVWPGDKLHHCGKKSRPAIRGGVQSQVAASHEFGGGGPFYGSPCNKRPTLWGFVFGPLMFGNSQVDPMVSYHRLLRPPLQNHAHHKTRASFRLIWTLFRNWGGIEGCILEAYDMLSWYIS